MSITAAKGSKLILKAVYVDADGNPTAAPTGAGPLAWSDSDPTVVGLETNAGDAVVADILGAFGANASITVSDGTLTSGPETISVGAGSAARLVIQSAPAG